MGLPEDSDLLYIAREGLKAPLPEPWKPCKTRDGEIYYFNFESGESDWEHPCDRYYKQLYQETKGKRSKTPVVKKKDNSAVVQAPIKKLGSLKMKGLEREPAFDEATVKEDYQNEVSARQKSMLKAELQHEVEQLQRDLLQQSQQESKLMDRQAQMELDRIRREHELQANAAEIAERDKHEVLLSKVVQGFDTQKDLDDLRLRLQRSLDATIQQEQSRIEASSAQATETKREYQEVNDLCEAAQAELTSLRRQRELDRVQAEREVKAKQKEWEERNQRALADFRLQQEAALQAKVAQSSSQGQDDLESQLRKLRQEYEAKYEAEKQAAADDYETEYSLLLRQATAERTELIYDLTHQLSVKKAQQAKDSQAFAEIEAKQRKLALQKALSDQLDTEKARLRQEFEAEYSALRQFSTPVKLSHDSLGDTVRELKSDLEELRTVLGERAEQVRKVKHEIRRINAELTSLESVPDSPAEFSAVINQEESRLSKLEAEVSELKQIVRTTSAKQVRPKTAPRAALNKWEKNLIEERDDLNAMKLSIEHEKQRFQRERKNFQLQPSVQKKVELSILKKVIDRQSFRIQERMRSIQSAEKWVDLHKQELEGIEDVTQGPLELSGELSPIDLEDVMDDTFSAKRPSTAKRYELFK
jgi:hypothetical protein